MACNGFIAALPDYANQDFCMSPCEDFTGDAMCNYTMAEYYNDQYGYEVLPVERIGTPEKARSLKKAIDVLCAMPEADCSLGVAVSGHSQGAFTSSYLATIDDRLTAVSPWALGDIPMSDTSCVYAAAVDPHLPQNKRRYIA